ncbi:hypothetical protein SPRG_02305 [Saprolegnia parasitica CBS 223.65]|uniref:EGF-like domain-containing protein n=1 Tax=Saprolegnia parasitica (strain CBS 223.65) TaxID=695850 RepID=A0A067D384_SAPPC|nr:hypothetical protein SPRG_02305 [Saprolegnia parasitica CBS 223.65]KDO33497.1 hypothetical protein SPRG_02305 [Saprolegnia parasitica CBS 223.65]|eukprot:XP_012196240.1 hypothetical protein SPRG_02305 [Saprolegnia parasitica CBS 223.65]
MATAVVVLLVLARLVCGACPGYYGRNCNGHGVCGAFNRCTCFASWTGVDCGLRTCPYGTPWSAVATALDTARMTATECSNMGACNRTTGACVCRDGFSGAACEKLDCANDCSGHGNCFSMADAALLNGASYTLWDANSIYGCRCDPGYTGYDCSLRTCISGHDPVVTGRLNERQAISCHCTTCTGTFMLTWNGRSSVPLAATASAADVEAALSAITSGVSVVFDGGATTICSTLGTSALVTFLHDFGPLPSLTLVLAAATLTVSVQAGGTVALYGTSVATVANTKQSLECSGRGVCNQATGQCNCALYFTSSDGQGSLGPRPDCGYYNTTGAPATHRCPAGIYESDYLATGSTVVCSGHGMCSNAPDYQCQCYQDWGGNDCSLRLCPTATAWFEAATLATTARTVPVACANAGICDNTLGRCLCDSNFVGAACEKLTCASRCRGTGNCRSMRQMAAGATTDGAPTPIVYGRDVNSLATWDADRIFGCVCNSVRYVIGNAPTLSGYDCSSYPCPSGDDPWTTGQVNEVQSLSCLGTAGSVTLTFRGATTSALSFGATAAALTAALEALPTYLRDTTGYSLCILYWGSIGQVAVSMPTGALCGATSAAVTTVSFLTNAGNVPLLIADASLLTGGPFSVTETTAGTTEDAVCNNRGNCDGATGRCICVQDAASSDGQGNLGVTRDCGYVYPFMAQGRL